MRAELFLFLAAFPSIASAQHWPNEPSDGQVVTSHGFDQKCPPPWRCLWQTGAIVPDPTAPMSPNNVYQDAWRNQNFSDIAQPIIEGLNARSIYIAFKWKPSNPFHGFNSGQAKIWLLDTFGTHNYLMMARNADLGPSAPYRFVMQPGGGNNCHVAASCYNLYSNTGYDPTIALGQWHTIEVCASNSGSPTSQNGIVRLWHDGRQVLNYTNINTPVATFDRFDLHHVWDQPGPYPGVTDYHWFDHVLIKKNVTCPTTNGGGTVPPPPPPPPTTPPPPPATNPGIVNDLTASAAGPDTVNLTFTEVPDGLGQPAKYDARVFAGSSMNWGSADAIAQGTCASPISGSSIGSKRTCTVTGLSPSTQYQFQVGSFRGTLNVDAVYGGLSNVAGATTSAAAAAADLNGDGATNVTDVQLAVNQALEPAACGSADIDKNGACNILDVQRVVNAAFGL